MKKYLIFTYSNLALGKNVENKVLFRVEEKEKTIEINSSLGENSLDTLYNIYSYIDSKTKSFILKKLICKDIPEWFSKCFRLNEFNDSIYGECLEIIHIATGLSIKEVTIKAESIDEKIITAIDDDSALLIFECHN